MFGNRKLGERSYTKYFELAIPENLFVHWAELFSDHEQSILSGKAGHYVHYQRKKNSAADHGAVVELTEVAGSWPEVVIDRVHRGAADFHDDSIDNAFSFYAREDVA